MLQISLKWSVTSKIVFLTGFKKIIIKIENAQALICRKFFSIFQTSQMEVFNSYSRKMNSAQTSQLRFASCIILVQKLQQSKTNLRNC